MNYDYNAKIYKWVCGHEIRRRRSAVGSLLPGGHAALAYSSRDSSGLAALSPLQQSDGHDAEDKDHAGHQTAATGAAECLFHVGEPEGADEAPGGADDVDEDADAGAVLDHAVDGVGDEDGGDDLVADGGDGDADLKGRVSGEFNGRCGRRCLRSA